MRGVAQGYDRASFLESLCSPYTIRRRQRFDMPCVHTMFTPSRLRLPAELPRVDIHHEPTSTQCRCGCQMQRIGEDVSERLDFAPAVFTVERRIRGKWVCAR